MFCLINRRHFSEKWLVLPRNYLITEFRGSNLMLPTYLTGSKWYFQWANLLLPLSVLNPGYTTEVLVDDHIVCTRSVDSTDKPIGICGQCHRSTKWLGGTVGRVLAW